MPSLNARPRRTSTSFFFILALAASALSAAAAPFKVLVLGFNDSNHPNTGAAGINAIKQLAVGQEWTVDVCSGFGQFTDSYLANYQVMVWVMAAPLSVSPANQAAFENYIKAGKGFLAFHVAGLTGISNPEWKFFMDYLGGVAFKGHPSTRQNGTIKVEATSHPAFQGITASFTVHEEWYAWNKSPRGQPDIQVLATVDETSYNPEGTRMGADHPMFWSNTKYGRMIYTGLGHEPEQYSNANVRKFLANAIPWAAGGTSTPVRFPLMGSKTAGAKSGATTLVWDGRRLRVAGPSMPAEGRDAMGRLFGAAWTAIPAAVQGR